MGRFLSKNIGLDFVVCINTPSKFASKPKDCSSIPPQSWYILRFLEIQNFPCWRSIPCVKNFFKYFWQIPYFPCLEKWKSKFLVLPVFPVPRQPCIPILFHILKVEVSLARRVKLSTKQPKSWSLWLSKITAALLNVILMASEWVLYPCCPKELSLLTHVTLLRRFWRHG